MRPCKLFRNTCLTLVTSVLVAGCTVGPNYLKPDQPAPRAWRAPLPHNGQPEKMADWWQQFNDPTLVELQKVAQADSPSLDKATAAIKSARATVGVSQAAGFPSLNLGASAGRAGDTRTDGSTTTTVSKGLDASWEISLFGGVQRSVESAQATLEARTAEWHEARVSLAAEVANDYIDYRACLLKQVAYQDQATSYQETLRLTRLSVETGFSAPSDLMLAEAGAATASADLIAQQGKCETAIKTLVAVTGLMEDRLRELLGTGVTTLPMPKDIHVGAVPAQVITQRPDVTSAERQLAAASAKIGVAEASRWPTFNITGSIALSRTLGVTTSPWSLVPALSLPLLDGGARASKVSIAEADYDAALATYKGTVRNAVKEVEQSLINLDSAARREQDVGTSARQYRNYFDAAEVNWRAGRTRLLDLELARRSALSADIALVDTRQAQVSQWITLYKAIGGGWDTATSINGGKE